MLSIRNVAQRFNFKPGAIRGWIHRGIWRQGRLIQLPATRIGGQYRIEERDVDWFLQQISNRNEPAGQRREAKRAERLARLVLG